MTAAIAYTPTENRSFSRKHDHALLSETEVITLARLVQKGDALARDKMAKSNLRLVLSMTRSYLRKHKADFEVLYNQGVEGLMIAIDKFDPDLGFQFSTYATPWIKCKIEEFLLKERAVHVPVHTIKMASKINRTRRTLETMAGRGVTDAEVAAELNIEEKVVKSLTQVIQPHTSLDAQIGDDEDGISFVSLMESETNDYDNVERDNVKSVLLGLIESNLDEREQIVVKAHYGLTDDEETTFAEIGRQLNLSRERVRQILVGSLQKMKGQLTDMGLDFSTMV